MTALLSLAVSGGFAPLRAQAGPAGSQGGEPDKKQKRERKQKQDEPPPEAPAARRPYKALFGGASTETDAAETLDFTGTLSEVYDQNLLADVTTPDVSNVLNSSGFYTAFSGDEDPPPLG